MILQRNFIIPGLIGLVIGVGLYFGSRNPSSSIFYDDDRDKSNRRAVTRQFISPSLDSELASEEALMKNAIDLVDNGEVEEARELFEQIIAKNPTHIRALLELSLIELLDQGRPDMALPYLIKALQLEPENDHLLGEVTDIYVETGQFEDGVRFLKQMLKQLPGTHAVMLRIGQLYYYNNELNRALVHLRPIKNSPTHGGQVMSLIARIYLKQNKLDQAIYFYAEAEQILERGVQNNFVEGKPGEVMMDWLESTQIEMAEGLISIKSFQYAEDILYKLSARIPSDPEVIKLMDLAKVGKRSNAG